MHAISGKIDSVFNITDLLVKTPEKLAVKIVYKFAYNLEDLNRCQMPQPLTRFRKEGLLQLFPTPMRVKPPSPKNYSYWVI